MKKYIVLFSVALLGLTACESDYLETKPEDKLDKEVILGSTEYAKTAINGICRSMSTQYLSTQGMNGEGTILNWYGTFTGNDAQKCNQTGWAALWNSTYHLRKSSIYLYYPWFYYYKLLGNANSVISNIDAAVGTDGEKAFVKAQALTFRAYSFFRLAQLYSFRWKDTQGNTPGVALRLDETTGDIPLSTLAETYTQIYKDLDEAISLYQKSGESRSEYYEPDVDVAYAIYAKAALTREDWQNAAKYAALARQGHPLMGAGEYIEGGFHKENSEWIWSVYDAEDQTLYYYSFFAYIGANSSAGACRNYPVAISKELIDQIPETDARRWLFLVPTEAEWAECNAAGRSTKSLYNRAFAEYGDRLYSTSLVYGYMQYKFLVDFYPGGGSFPIIRAAEMYYTEAEADCHLGKEAEAQQLLFEAVKPYDEAYEKSTNTGDDLLTEVKLYRRFDLWGEGNDWFDYKRWGDTIARKSIKNGGSFHNSFAVTIKPEDGNNWTWAIPEKETDYNDLID